MVKYTLSAERLISDKAQPALRPRKFHLHDYLAAHRSIASACFRVLIVTSCTAVGVAWANPEGGHVAAGSATIQQTRPSRLDVIQQSSKAVIDWRKFSIDPGEHTNFQQPSSAAVALNRVKGADSSNILGRLTANGRVFLVNPNGVFIGKDARVDVAGLVATTADIRNQNFMNGRYVFDIPPDDPNAAVVNRGQIHIAENGFAVLAAPAVRNEGLIQARLGKVALAGTDTFILDFEGDGLLAFGIKPDIKQVPVDENGEPVDALVSNTGEILADGGVVVMSTQAAQAVVANAINMEGIIQAQAVKERNGAIILSGGGSGIVAVTGTLDASGPEDGQTGGTVKVLGEKVGLFDGAHIDARGDSGGGEVLVGGNIKGKGPEPNAKRTYVENDATINADGITTGDGGKIIVWADEGTGFNGGISARGGSVSGNGGFVEVSGKTDLSFHGWVDLSVADGDTGTLLLDPANITIVNGSSGPDDSELDDNQILAGDSPGATFTISEGALEALPASANVVLEATDDITIEDLADNVLLFATGPGGSITFTMNADSGLDGGSFVMNTGDTIRAQGRNVTISGPGPTGLPVVQATIGTINTSDLSPGSRGGDVTVQIQGNVTTGDISSRGSVTGVAGGSINISSVQGTVDTTAGALESLGSGGGDITVQARGNVVTGDISSRGLITSVGGSVGGSINISSIQGSVDTTAGALDSFGPEGGDITVQAQGNVTTGGISSRGLIISVGDSVGGSINIGSIQGAVDTTAGVLDSSSTDADGVGGAIALEAAGGIATGAISSTGAAGSGDLRLIADGSAIIVGELSSSSVLGEAGTILLKVPGDITTGNIFASSAISGTGGDITLLSGGAIDTTAGELNTISVQGEAGAILLDATGDITAGDIFASSINLSGVGTANTGGSGGITLSSVNGSISTGRLLSPTQASFGTAGSSKGITVTANNGSITSDGLVWAFSSAAIDGGTGNSGDGGEISFSAKNDIDIVGSIETGSRSDAGNALNAGAVSITSTDGNISVADSILASSNGSGTSGDGGAIALSTDGRTSTRDIDSSSSGSGQGGDISIDSGDAIDTSAGTLDASSSSGQGGAINLTTQGGNITTSTLTSRTFGGPGSGGDITLAVNGVGGSIDTTAGELNSFSANSNGGAISLTTQDGNISTGTLFSRSAVGATGGDITLTINGSTGSIDASTGLVDSRSNIGLGAGDIDLTAPTFITVANIDANGSIGSGNVSLTSDEIDLVGGPSSVQSQGALLFQPFNDINIIQKINIGINDIGGTDTLDITTTDLAALADGFDSITFGSTSSATPIYLGLAGINVNDALLFQSPADGGAIVVDGAIQTNGNNLALEAGSLIDIYANITTSGGAIGMVSGGTIDTGASILDSSSTDEGGAISLDARSDITTGPISTTVLDDPPPGSQKADVAVTSRNGSINMTGSVWGGAITLNTPHALSVAGVLNALSNRFANAGDIIIGDAFVPMSIDIEGVLTTRNIGGGGGGDIDITTTGSLNVRGAFLRETGVSVDPTSPTIDPADIASIASEADGDGGDIRINTGGGISTAAGIVSHSRSSGNGGSLTLISEGAIATGVLDSSSVSGDGGSIDVSAVGNINTGSIDTRSLGDGQSGDISLGSDGAIGIANVDAGAQMYRASAVSLRGDFATGGRSFTVHGNATLESDAVSVVTDGGNINFTDQIDGESTLELLAGRGSITLGAVGQFTELDRLDATGGSISLQDVTTTGPQSYIGSVTFNSDYVTDGDLFAVEGKVTLASDTSIKTDGGDIVFDAPVDGRYALTLTAGDSGNVSFKEDVGNSEPLDSVNTNSAGDIALVKKFIAGPTKFLYTGTLTSSNPSLGLGGLKVDSLHINPDAASATIFGEVASMGGRDAALAVTGPKGDPSFTINGFVIGPAPGPAPPLPPEAEPEPYPPLQPESPDGLEEPGELIVVEKGFAELAAFYEKTLVRLPQEFNMSDFPIEARVKAGWPLIIDYQLERPGVIRIAVTVDKIDPVTFELPSPAGRKTEVFRIPQRFGGDPKLASIRVTASETEGTGLVPLRLYGFGAGPKALGGSVAIDEILFSPPFLRALADETSAYRFFSHSDFDTLLVDFCHVTSSASGEKYRTVNYHLISEGIRADEWIGELKRRVWNGRDENEDVSAGLHKLQIRAWDEAGEWLTAWSESFLEVQ